MSAYDEIADAYEQRKLGQPAAPWADALLDRLAQGLGAGALVADLGCGPGLEAQHLTARGLAVVGVDASVGMLRRARARLPGRLVQARLEALPLRAGALDGVWSLHALLHVDDHAGALAEVVRVLRPGGLAALTFAVGPGTTCEPVPFAPGVTRRFVHRPVAQLDRLLAGAGLRVLEAGLDAAGRRTRWVLARRP